MKKKLLYLSLAVGISFHAAGQTAPFALSPKWVFGNKAMFDFTGGGGPTQPVRPAGDNIIANEGSGTLCRQDKDVLVYSNNVRIGGNNQTPLASFMVGSSSSTQGGIIIPNPSDIANGYYIITGNAESEYMAQEPNDNAQEGIKVYSGSRSGATVTNPALVASLFAAGSGTPEQVAVSVDNNYGYWILYQTGTFYASGDPNFNARRVTTGGVSGATVTSSYNTFGNWNFQAQGTIKLNRCQNKLAIVQSSKIAVFNYDRATGQIGSVIKYLTGVDVGGGSKLYGCEFSENGRYLYASTLGGSNLIVVDTDAAGGISTGLSYKAGQTASGSLQIGPNGVIYVANGLDGSTNANIGTITAANTGGTYTPAGLALANSSTVRLGIGNIPWLNPQRPTISQVNNSCGNYTLTPSFLTHFNDAIGVSSVTWNFGDGTPNVTNSGASAMNAVNHSFEGSTGNKTVTITVTDAVCSYTWTGTLTFNVPCILPVKLTSFDAIKFGDDARIFWTTAEEENNSHFVVMHSTDGVNFSPIGTVKGNGNSASTIDYSFIHNDPSEGENYYQLVQYDLDGKSQSSEIISLDFGTGLYVNVAPNPSADNFNLTIIGANEATVLVTDMAGREVMQTKLNNIETSFAFGDDLASASYIVKVFTENDMKAIKIQKR